MMSCRTSVKREIRLVATRRPDLTPALRAAYHDALPQGRRFIEQALEGLDPSLLAKIRSDSQR
jgi:hypothetical protein